MEMYQAIGGMGGCRKLAETFYGRVARDPELAPLFPRSLHCAIDAFTLFLAEFLGGPAQYSETRWYVSLQDAHARFRIGAKERAAWLRNMAATLRDTPAPVELRDGLYAFFEQSSQWIAGQPETAVCPHREIARRGESQRSVEHAVQAIHAGDPNPALAMETGPVTLASLLALMVDSECCRERLRRQPELAQVRQRRGRTLLHEAAGAGSLATVKLLLELGADPNALDGGGHDPLYCLANECGSGRGAEVVRLLVRAGADVRAQTGVQRCTALHMAARRGSVGIAAALLECGAPKDARDRRGDTPLMRAINCKKTHVAALLGG
jgi:hemoglobin